MSSSAAMTTGRYSGLQPAMTACVATLRTVATSSQGGTGVTTSSGALDVPASMRSIRSSVGVTTGRPSDQGFSRKNSNSSISFMGCILRLVFLECMFPHTITHESPDHGKRFRGFFTPPMVRDGIVGAAYMRPVRFVVCGSHVCDPYETIPPTASAFAKTARLLRHSLPPQSEMTLKGSSPTRREGLWFLLPSSGARASTLGLVFLYGALRGGKRVVRFRKADIGRKRNDGLYQLLGREALVQHAARVYFHLAR